MERGCDAALGQWVSRLGLLKHPSREAPNAVTILFQQTMHARGEKRYGEIIFRCREAKHTKKLFESCSKRSFLCRREEQNMTHNDTSTLPRRTNTTLTLTNTKLPNVTRQARAFLLPEHSRNIQTSSFGFLGHTVDKPALFYLPNTAETHKPHCSGFQDMSTYRLRVDNLALFYFPNTAETHKPHRSGF
jgi:hypothetical protein